MNAVGSIGPGPALAEERLSSPPLCAPGARPLTWLVGWVPIVALGVLATQNPMGRGGALMPLAVIGGLGLFGLTMFAGIRELRAAEARAHAALTRAEAAEAAARARAEELAIQLSETQRMQQQLVQASKMAAVGELAAAVAHEVNNPLTGILGFSELLLAELGRDDPKRADVAVVHSEALRARSIVRALVEFARPRPPQRIATHPNALVKSALDLMRFRAEEHRVAIVEEYGRVADFEVDPDALKQVLLNLFSNALEAMPSGGELRISTLGTDDLVGLRVTDNGVGMDASTRSRMFTPFFTTRAGAQGGTGLGLSVGLRIVEAHGGSIEVASEAGSGSTFTIWLPIADAAHQDAAMAPSPESPALPGGGGTPTRGTAA